MSAAEIGDAIYVANPGDDRGRYWLARLERTGGRVAWRTYVLSAEINVDIAGGGPPAQEVVEFVLKEGRLYVFGLCGTTAYIEAFDAASGRPLLRCSTWYGWVGFDNP